MIIALVDADHSDRFFAYMLDLGTGPLMNICVDINSANNRRFAVNSYIGSPMHVEVSKGAQSINYIKVNGTIVSGVAGSAVFDSACRHFGYYSGATAGYHFYGTVWDVIIEGLHWWEGHPVGNTNPAWVDQIGVINGTVNGAPALWPC